jgi:beta-lactamase class A
VDLLAHLAAFVAVVDEASFSRADRRAQQAPDIDYAVGTAARDAFEALRAQ